MTYVSQDPGPEDPASPRLRRDRFGFDFTTASGSTPSRRDYAPEGRAHPPAWKPYGLEAASERGVAFILDTGWNNGMVE